MQSPPSTCSGVIIFHGPDLSQIALLGKRGLIHEFTRLPDCIHSFASFGHLFAAMKTVDAMAHAISSVWQHRRWVVDAVYSINLDHCTLLHRADSNRGLRFRRHP